jgi:peptidoglycan/xylan/chitin deacetylase (PgdA/CDA1 family)
MKDAIRKLLIPALTSHTVSAIAERFLGRSVPIFSVHRLEQATKTASGVTPEHLRNCLAYLRAEGFHLASLEELILAVLNQAALPEKSVVFTMDDGFNDQADTSASIFIEFDCPLTFFVITDMIDRTLWPWDAQISWIVNNTENGALRLELSDESIEIKITDNASRITARKKIQAIMKELDAETLPATMNQLARAAGIEAPSGAPPPYEALSWDTARRLERQGIRFAPHSRSHRILSKLSDESAREEITGAWKALERELSNPLKVFCYPTGRLFDFGPREISHLKEAGFLGATSSLPGLVNMKDVTERLAFCLPRISLPDTMAYFIQCCSWIEHANRNRASRTN